MHAFFKLIRWKNLTLIAIMQLLIYDAFLYKFSTQQDFLPVSLIIIATLLLTASGYIINDIYDVKADLINKPNNIVIEKQLSIKKAFIYYTVLTFFGVLLGSYVAFFSKASLYNPFFYQIPILISKLIFVIIAITLYLYSRYLKGIILLGNIIVSKLLAISIVIIPLLITPYSIKKDDDFWLFNMFVIMIYAYVAFFINLIREIVKDIEDIEGDYTQGYKTLPILLGRKFAKNTALCISILTMMALIYLSYNFLKANTLALSYSFMFIIAPLIYCIYKLYDAKRKKEFKHISTILKLIIFFGILSIPIIANSIKHVIT